MGQPARTLSYQTFRNLLFFTLFGALQTRRQGSAKASKGYVRPSALQKKGLRFSLETFRFLHVHFRSKMQTNQKFVLQINSTLSGGGELLQVTGLDRQQACRTNCENGLGMDTCYIIFDEHYGNEICDTIYSSLLHMKLEPNRMITVSGSIESLI